MRILCEAEGVVRAGEGRLQVAEHDIDGLEVRALGRCCAAASDVPFVKDAGSLDDGEATQPVGHEGRRRSQRLGGELFYRRFRERPLRETDQYRCAGGRCLHRRDHRDLVRRAAPGLATVMLSAKVSVVDFHPTCELARVFAPAHDLHDLVLHQPGCGVGHAKVALEFKRSNIVLDLRHQVHRQEPCWQRQLAGIEDGAGDKAALVAACAALKVQPAGAPELTVLSTRTSWADEPQGPTRRAHGLLALLWPAVGREEVDHRSSRLKLDFVLRHDSSPVVVTRSLQPDSS